MLLITGLLAEVQKVYTKTLFLFKVKGAITLQPPVIFRITQR